MLLRKEQQLDPTIKEKLTIRAQKANEDIKSGKVYTRKEADAKLNSKIFPTSET